MNGRNTKLKAVILEEDKPVRECSFELNGICKECEGNVTRLMYLDEIFEFED